MDEQKEVEELAIDLKEIRECEIHDHSLLLDGEVAIKLYAKGYRKHPSEGNQGAYAANYDQSHLKEPSGGWVRLDEDKFFELLKGYHGGNPKWWIKELQSLWDEHFSKMGVPAEEHNACLEEVKRMN